MKVNRSYFIMAFPIAIIEILLVYWCIMDFSILHVGWAIMGGVLLTLHILWSNPKLFEDRDQVNKAIHEWNKRKKYAMKNNLPFTEPRPKPSKIMTPPVGALAGAVIGIIAFGSLFLMLLNFPLAMGKSGYSVDIVRLKNDRPDKYFFFPDNLPENATDVKWRKQPGFGQGQGFEILSFHADSNYINQMLDLYCKEIEPQAVYDMPVWPDAVTDMTDAEREKAEWYPIYDNGDQHRQHAWGIAVHRDSNLIVFFAQ